MSEFTEILKSQMESQKDDGIATMQALILWSMTVNVTEQHIVRNAADHVSGIY